MARLSSTKKRKYKTPEVGEGEKKGISVAVSWFVFLLMGIYPLYYENKYFNMGDAKWHFFKTVSYIFVVVIAILFIFYISALACAKKFKEYVENVKNSLVTTDYFVLAYLFFCIVSTILAPDKKVVIFGYEGWYMGLAAQFGFVMLYLLVSRFWKWDSLAVLFYMSVSTLVFFFGIIMRFRIDPMEMYIGLQEMHIRNFISTLGQTSWYSSYMTIIYPISMLAYWLCKETWQRITFGIFTAIGFMTAVTQNSDSAYLALVGIMFVLFWVSMEDNIRFLRFLEIIMMALGSFVFMGVCQLSFPERRVYLDKLSTFMSQDILIKYLLAASILLYVCFYMLNKNGLLNVRKFAVIRYVFLVILLLGVMGGIAYIYANTTGMLPENLRTDNNYLLFDDTWGNNRGLSWRSAVGTFMQCDWMRKLFGAGPDSFASLVYQYYGEPLRAMWGENTTLTCCHNEWLNAIINMGVFGGIAYFGIFIAAFFRYMKMGKTYPEVYAIAMSVIAYILHNVFCYQQIICTPIIFILMGVAEAIIRRGTQEDE